MNPSIVEIAAKSSVIIALAAAVVGVMRRRGSAASRHLVWILAVAGLLVLPLASSVLPAWSIAVKRETPAPDVQQATEVPAASAVAAQLTAAPDSAQRSVIFAPISWIALLPIAYAAGVVLLLGRLGVEHWKTRLMLSRTLPVEDADWTTLLDECVTRLGVRRTVRLVRSREEAMPMACGIRRPAIVIPSIADVWDGDRRRAVILHELAHVMRFDCLTQMLAEAAVAVYWPHPGVWWAAQRLRVERELACDDCVLASGTEPREYAGHLLEIAHSLGRYHAPALAVSMARPRQLEGRMMAMLDATRNRATPAASRRLLAVAVAAFVVAPLAAATVVATRAAAPAAQARAATAIAAGTWQIRLGADGRTAHLAIGVGENSFHSTTIPLDRVDGLAAILNGPGGPAHYTLKREAGAFDFEGIVRSGAGGGTFSFTPDPAFADALVKRGFGRPTLVEQGKLAWADIGFTFLDELDAQKYARPTLQQLVGGAEHGVNRTYVREMSDLGYRVGSIDALIRLRDHGVNAGFVREMQAEQFRGLSVDELVRARDHGIDPAFIRDLRTLGYGLNLDQLVEARNHGIDGGYVREMRAAGFAKLSLDDLVNARNHGVDAGFERELRQLGYQLTLDELVDARNHGIDAAFVKEMSAAGYRRLSLDELIKLRNHGIDAKVVERLKSRGVDHPPVDRLIQLHERGARAETGPIGPRLQASQSLMAGVHRLYRDANTAVERFVDRWLK